MNDLQRTREWYLARKGHVTASECYLLLNNRRVAMTDEELAEWKKLNPKSKVTTKEVPFNDTTLSYLDGKVAEMYMPDDAFMEYMGECKYETKAMQWGTAFEDEARKRYEQETGCRVEDAPFIPLAGYEQMAGGSPDGLVTGEDEGIIEIKCPYNPAVHLRHFLYTKPEELKEDYVQYYAQMQYNMLVVSCQRGKPVPYCDFISYDPRISRSKQLKVLRIPRDDAMQLALHERTTLAVEYMRYQIDRINETKSIIK